MRGTIVVKAAFIAALGIALGGAPAVAQEFGSPELIAAAKRPSQVYVTTFLMCVFMALFSGPYASFVNILFGPHPLVIFRGQVTDKSVIRGRHSQDYVVTILTDEENKRMKFKVSSTEFSELDLGSHFSRTMKVGCLGIPYRLKW